MEANGLPSRTSILTAAARAFGSREPDASVRNPDWVAGRLIGPDSDIPAPDPGDDVLFEQGRGSRVGEIVGHGVSV